MDGALRAYLPHLRLPFQLTLAPIFLWGALLSGGGWRWETVAAFVSLHLFLYPAATAFNSAYDKDEGPVGGMEEPPPVPPGLLGFSLALGAAGALFAIPAGGAFLLTYVLAAGWTAAYSHPATRWKAGPLSSTLAIGLGQGVVGFLAGWAAAAPLGSANPVLLAGAASAAFTAVGLYPATQVFQVAEDRARGDRTLAGRGGHRARVRPSRALATAALHQDRRSEPLPPGDAGGECRNRRLPPLPPGQGALAAVPTR
jgi:1,4-dihydroxy-2-naphthoate octaprenyltransferase